MNHYCWQYVKNGDYEGFYDYEIALRKRRRYPPFINLALLRISYPMDWADGPTQLARITALLRSESKGVTVLGPAPAPLPSRGDAGGFSASSRLETGNHPCPLCRASASRLAPEPAYFTGYRPREHAVARKTFFLKRKAASGTTDAKGLSAAHPASWVQPCKGGRRSCDCVRCKRGGGLWRRFLSDPHNVCFIGTNRMPSATCSPPVRTKPSRWYALTAEGAALTVSGAWGARLRRWLRNVSKSRRPIPCL